VQGLLHKAALPLVLLVTASLLGCAQGKTPSADAGPTPDAGVIPPVDSGPSIDGLGAIDAAPAPDACPCLAGLCCDGCNYLPDTTRCGGAALASAYQCNVTVCGADAEYQEQYQYCNGTSGQCGTDNLVWEAWQTLDDCDANALCSSDGTSASCSPCGSGCVGDSCVCGQGGNVVTVATAGTMTISGGSSDQVTYGPHKMNDGQLEASCGWCWIDAGQSPGSAWIQLNWASAQQLWGFTVDTVSLAGTSCEYADNRPLAGATIQWWNGSSWVTDGATSGNSADWSYQFTAPIDTTAIRLYGVYASTLDNPVVFEWQVFACN
jgi:hypothetical protein